MLQKSSEESAAAAPERFVVCECMHSIIHVRQWNNKRGGQPLRSCSPLFARPFNTPVYGTAIHTEIDE